MVTKAGAHSHGPHTVTIKPDGGIIVKQGDWLSKYSAAMYQGDVGKVYEYGRMKAGGMKKIIDVDRIRTGETIYHLPTFVAFSQTTGVKPQVSASTNIWYGLGVNYGGHWFVIGKHNTHAWLFSLDNYEKNFVFTSEGWRVGPGLGGSWGISFIIITSLWDPYHLNSRAKGEVDFQLALGPKWGELLKNAKHLKSVQRIVKMLEKAEEGTPLAKHLLKLSLEDWEAIAGRIKELISSLDMNIDGVLPSIVNVGIPVGAGAEVSLFYEFKQFRVELYNQPPSTGR